MAARTQVDRAGDYDGEAGIEREEAGPRPFGAPADADSEAADNDD